MKILSGPQKGGGRPGPPDGLPLWLCGAWCGFWNFPWEGVPSAGMACVQSVSRRPPGSAVITTSLPEDPTRGHSVRARKHFFFLLIQTVQFPSDLQMSGWPGRPAHLPHLAPGTYCSRATWQKTDSAFKQSCLLGHRLYKTKTTVPLDSINL